MIINEHKNRIHDRIEQLIENPDGDLSKEALVAKLTELIFHANELSFSVRVALRRLGINDDNGACKFTQNFNDAMINIDIDMV